MPLQPQQEFRVPIAKPKTLGPEHNPWHWNPNRLDAKRAPVAFLRQVHDIGSDLDVIWNPITDRWQVFCVKPEIQHRICHGWKLLFIHQTADGKYLPLDERLLARIYGISAKHQNLNGRQYFEQVMAAEDREKARREKHDQQDLIDAAMPSFEHAQISVAMRGKSNGSKYSTYHA